MIKSILSITFKIALSALTLSILMFGALMLALSFGKSEIENQLNQLVFENKLEIDKIVEERLSLEFDYDENTTCTRWLKFLDEIDLDQDTQTRLQEWIGYLLIPSTKLQKCLFFKMLLIVLSKFLIIFLVAFLIHIFKSVMTWSFLDLAV